MSASLPCPPAQPAQLWRHPALATLTTLALQQGCAGAAPKALATLSALALQQGCAASLPQALAALALQQGCAAAPPKFWQLSRCSRAVLRLLQKLWQLWLCSRALHQGCAVAPPKTLSQPQHPAMARQAGPLAAWPWQGAAAHHGAGWVGWSWHPAGKDWASDLQEGAVEGGWHAALCPQLRGQ